jgi:hypothetical protein
MDDLYNYLQSICDRVDALDATSLGDLPAALDNLAAEASRARSLCDAIKREKTA